MKHQFLPFLLSFGLCGTAFAQFQQNNPGSNHGNKFEQLETIIRDPNMYRSASGAPGPKYWQQEADYDINAEVDDKTQRLTGSETITYTNNSPDPLTYLWLQLDENEHKATSDNQVFDGSKMSDKMSVRQLNGIIGGPNDYGVNILKATDGSGNPLTYTINQTMMRIELPKTLAPGAKFVFKINWNYKITDRLTVGGRGGYEYFPADDNYLYTITQWYPRMAVYSDFQGWQNKQFTGRGEFALTFGDFKVNITVPADHVIGATGECQNYSAVLTSAQYNRWKQAQSSNEPVEVVTLAEAQNAMKAKSTAKKTWTYVAHDVRDFAFVTSRRLVWDAMKVNVEGKTPMAMSYYGPEAYGLYRKYSTKVIANTLKVYSKHTIAYPYPVAISVEASNGMEYPMICFNYGRTEKDGTYSEATKYGMIGVITHEVGHNFFPMIINSDERQWTWMDEGLNTFCQFLAEQEFDINYPSRRGPAHLITDYMKLPKDQLEPIMTNSENIVNFGPNAYAKPATALNVLRETIMGRELFDYAFKEYARRWAFKHPTPADFFRTMEDASAVDLDWFWRGWFYGTDPVDISIDNVTYYRMDTKNPAVENAYARKEFDDNRYIIGRERNRQDGIKFAVEADTSLVDFYSKWDRFAVTDASKADFNKYYAGLSPEEKKIYDSKTNFYQIDFTNKGGLVSPIILEWTYTDGTKEVERIPAYIWRKDENKVTKVFAKAKQMASVKLDPYLETADIDVSNNSFPRSYEPTKFELFKQQQTIRGASSGGNPMQEAKKNQK
ncbi:MAG: M1 family metallopeptidase [Bacteroidetes bacterium]|nr:M1 family metallopeptidase [Bacteroidota bacterium]MBU1373675.1 M1 family metallopeptidase [Bacteroidota bacterium]MBU1485159.1 M1 family metallopeptidase [Bacteroidota bacterium]MBU1759706.1 M1 family metallopeptidase [Bacteroidota bacterium]MBU2266598.1 M1 family metallopeptidase [Bacteroidota bacterium]